MFNFSSILFVIPDIDTCDIVCLHLGAFSVDVSVLRVYSSGWLLILTSSLKFMHPYPTEYGGYNYRSSNGRQASWCFPIETFHLLYCVVWVCKTDIMSELVSRTRWVFLGVRYLELVDVGTQYLEINCQTWECLLNRNGKCLPLHIFSCQCHHNYYLTPTCFNAIISSIGMRNMHIHDELHINAQNNSNSKTKTAH